MREQQVVLEHHPGATPLDRHEHVGRGVVEHRPGQLDPPAGQRDQAGERTQRRRLAGAVGAEQRHHLAGGDLETQVEDEAVSVDPEVGAQADGPPGAHVADPATQRSRRQASTTTETSSSTRDRTIADSGSVSSAR